METAGALIEAIGETATWNSRTLGARSGVTNWPAESFTSSSIHVRVDEISTREIDLGGGRVTEKRMKLFTVSALKAQDQLIYKGDTFEVESDSTPVYLLGKIAFYRVVVVKNT